MFAVEWSVSPTAPASNRAIILHSVVPQTHQGAGLGIHAVGSFRGSPLQKTTQSAGHLSTPPYVNRFRSFGTYS